MNSENTRLHVSTTPTSSEHGISLVEIMVASLVGMLAISGILYLYKAQHKSMMVQEGSTEMRMNGQYALNEAQYYLSLAGLGLPPNFKCLSASAGDLVIRMNTRKKYSPAKLDPAGDASHAIYRIPAVDVGLFAGRSFAAAWAGNRVVEVRILAIGQGPGSPGEALLTLAGNKNDFNPESSVYPVERIRLHRCTGLGADTAAGDFQTVHLDADKWSSSGNASQVLAEGIESLTYRFFMANKDSVDALPSSLDSLTQIGIKVVAKSPIRDRHASADGFKRDTLMAKMSFRRVL